MIDRQAVLVNPSPMGFLGRLNRNQQIALGILGLLTAAVIAFFVNQARGPEYVVAFTNMRDDDTAAVVAKLKDARIPYELADRGTIKIPATQLQEARLIMSTQGVQSKGSGVGFELFNEPHFGQTEFAEKVNYQRALEGELSRTIGRIDAVEAARVHLVIPQPSLFVSQQKEASASIVVQLKNGKRLDNAQIQGITNLVAGSVESLKATNVTVMDTAGNVLSDKQGASDPTRQTGSRTDVQRSLESRIEQDIRTMLFQVVGPDKAIVRVNADLNWDQYESSSETFSPENKQPQIRSQRTVSEAQAQSAGSGSGGGGVPGADSNIPTYPGGAPGAGGAQGQTDRRDSTTNYELSKTVEKIVRAPGGVRRLSVAVALDSGTVTDDAQADAISRLVATAAGLNTERGDLVTLTSLPFNGVTEMKPLEAAEQARQFEMLLSIARMVAMVLGPLMVALLIWMILRKGRPRPEPETLQPMLASAVPVTAGALPGSEEQDADDAPEPLPVRELGGGGRQDPEQDRIRRELRAIAESNPASVAQLIRSWLSEDRYQMPGALTGRQKAAVLLVALGPAASASVIRHLREVEIEQLTVEVFSTDEISEETVKEVLDESFEMTMASGLLGSGGYDYARQMLTGALGDSKATEILSRLAVNLRPKHFDFLRDTDPAQLATFFQEYQPQAIAFILSHLHPNLASKVLALLPAEIQPEVAMRIATMERTSPEVIEGVESVLKRRLSSVMTGTLSTVGGIECLVKMLSMVDRTTERVILEYLDKHGPEVATDVRNQMFVFDNLTQLDDTSLQRVLREVDTRDLGLAMRGASDELRERIFRNLSTRAADILREDMAVSGPLRLRLVEEAQQKIVAIVRRLDEGGDIVIQRGDDVLV